MTFDRDLNRQFAVGVSRAFAGALLFSLPILMTMEMWSLGFHMERHRLALLLVVMLPLLVGLAYYVGFEDATGLLDAILDAFVAIIVAAVTATVFLVLFGALDAGMGINEWIGKLSLQAIPGSIGALLAQGQLGRKQEEGRKRRESGDFGEYFFMCAGALFFAANVAPTEEVVLIAYRMTAWQIAALALLSLVLVHAFVYGFEFKGQHDKPEETSPLGVFVRFSIVGYILVLLISAYLCWSFGRFDGDSLDQMIRITIVLGFPAAVGAAAARLVL